MSSALILLSGGIDSAAALAWAQKNHDNLFAISFEYYLRPFREKLAVYRLLQHLPAHLIELRLPFLKEASDVNPNHSTAPEGYVSNRNMIFYSIASHFAEMNDCHALVGGHTVEDEEAFPDAGSNFLSRLNQLMNQALVLNKIQIELPLIQLTKLEVLQKAIEWKVPLQHTWSCYWDRSEPCGECISCKERADAFKKLGLRDPLVNF